MPLRLVRPPFLGQSQIPACPNRTAIFVCPWQFAALVSQERRMQFSFGTVCLLEQGTQHLARVSSEDRLDTCKSGLELVERCETTIERFHENQCDDHQNE